MFKQREHSGQSTLELPICLFIILVCIFLPLVDLALIGMRSTTVFAAARDGARVAGRANYFSQAKLLAAGQVGLSIAQGFAGVHTSAEPIKVFLIGVPIQPGPAPIRQEGVLTEIKPDQYVYQIEVVVTARVDPLITLNTSIFQGVPGLTEPLTVTATSREFVEHANGLAR